MKSDRKNEKEEHVIIDSQIIVLIPCILSDVPFGGLSSSDGVGGGGMVSMLTIMMGMMASMMASMMIMMSQEIVRRAVSMVVVIMDTVDTRPLIPT